jgi:hypothetical protein
MVPLHAALPEREGTGFSVDPIGIFAVEARATTTKASSTAAWQPGFSGIAHARSATNRSRDDRESPKLTTGERERTKPDEGGSEPGDVCDLLLRGAADREEGMVKAVHWNQSGRTERSTETPDITCSSSNADRTMVHHHPRSRQLWPYR